MRKAVSKLRSRRGMSLTEVLAAVLVLSLVTLGVAVGINSALNVYRRSVALSDAQTLSATLSAALMDELRCARDVKTVTAGEGGSIVTFTSAAFGEDVSVGQKDGYLVIAPPDWAPGEGDAVNTWPLLVGTGTYAGYLRAEHTVTYADGTFAVTLNIYDGAATDPIRTRDFSVANLQARTGGTA